MIEILDLKSEDLFGYRVDGKVEKADMEMVFDEIERKTADGQRLKVYAEIRNMSIGDLTQEAMKEEVRRLFKHPRMLVDFNKAVVVTDIGWIRKAFDIECALIPTLTGKSFSVDEAAAALEWLQADQRAGQRLDITFTELAETSALKFAGGFAFGLLAASLFDSKQRKALGLGVLAGSMIVGLPLGIKFLNNNRQLFEEKT